jgi:uncharacterized delta-60 repeat protein
MKTLIFAALFSVYSTGLYSQYSNLDELWKSRYNSGEDTHDELNYMRLDNEGNIIVTGTSPGKIETMKYNPSGMLLWQRSIEGRHYELEKGICIDADNNIYVIGNSPEGRGALTDLALVKYSPAGTEEWVRHFDVPEESFELASSVAADEAGNVYVTGTSTILNQRMVMVTLKYNSSGVLEWSGIVDGNDKVNNSGRAVNVDSKGNVIVTGMRTEEHRLSERHSLVDYVIVKYSPDGELIWDRRFYPDEPSEEFVRAALVDRDDNIYVTGISTRASGGTYFLTVKYTPEGMNEWWKFYAPASGEASFPSRMVLDNSGSCYITGLAQNKGCALVKYSRTGAVEWERFFSNTNSIGRDVTLDAEGDIYVTGQCVRDFLIQKYTPSGSEVWNKVYESNDAEEANFVCVQSNKNIVIGGKSYTTPNKFDFLVVSFSELTGVNPGAGNIPTEYKLYQNYPNPFNPSTVIRFDVAKESFVSLKVYDVSGKEIAQLVNSNMNAGSYKIDFSGSKLHSGVYFYKLIAGKYSETRKMLLLK